MSFSAHHLPAIVLVLSGLSVSVFAQSTTKEAMKTPRGSVSGRVTIKDKGAAGVVVGMRKNGGFTPLEPFVKAKTDQDGFYRFTDVAPGSYAVMPSASAYVMANSKYMRSKTVLVGEDEDVDGVNFALVRGGVVTGRVTDADGRPVIQQQVNLYRVETLDQVSSQRPAFPTDMAETDDRGIYRMFGLEAGRYKASVGRAEGLYDPSSFSSRTVYKQVFHPDVTDQAKATIIEVTEGSEANNVDITLARALPTFSASGRIVDAEKSLPVPNVRFGLQRITGQRVEFVNTAASTNTQGDFIAEGLIPGKYAVYVQPSEANEMRAETLIFDIIDQDVSGLTVRLTKGASLSGVVVLENEDKAALAKLSQMQLRGFALVTTPGTGTGFGNTSSSPIAPDGSFRLAGLPAGTINLQLGSVMGIMVQTGFSIARVEREGVVVQRGVEVREGEQVTGVRIIVSHGNATLRGVVKLENGSLPEGARIFVRVMKPSDTMSTLRPPQVNERGQFLMSGLAPGIYEVTASMMGAASLVTRPVKKEVAVQDGIVTEVTLILDLATIPKP